MEGSFGERGRVHQDQDLACGLGSNPTYSFEVPGHIITPAPKKGLDLPSNANSVRAAILPKETDILYLVVQKLVSPPAEVSCCEVPGPRISPSVSADQGHTIYQPYGLFGLGEPNQTWIQVHQAFHLSPDSSDQRTQIFVVPQDAECRGDFAECGESPVKAGAVGNISAEQHHVGILRGN